MAKKVAKKTTKAAANALGAKEEVPLMPSPSMRETIIKAIDDSGRSVRSIALAAGISQPQLSRFVKGERDLLLEAADRVARSLGLGLRKIDD